ncbi:MAG: radical SAM protein [Candidatus Hermodarchaeota archaeon]
MVYIFKNKSDFDLYGLWNCLVVLDERGKHLGNIPAHDGDFFPESPLDYIESLRTAVRSKISLENLKPLWPIRVDIDIIQECTDHCKFCYSRKYALDPPYHKASISDRLFFDILNELKKNGTRTIRFTGGGEPLLHPSIKKFIYYVKKCGFKSCVLTNGDLLNTELCKLIVENSDHVRISLNAFTEETRYKLHKPKRKSYNINSLNDIIKNVEFMVKVRNQGRFKEKRRPIVGTTFLLLPENVAEIYDITKKLKATGVDSISFRPVYHDLRDEFSNSQQETLINQLNKVRKFHSPPEFLVFTPKRDVHTVWDLNPRKFFNSCISSKIRTVIESTIEGPKFEICGLYRGSYKNRNSVKLKSKGSEFSFQEIWNSEEMNKILSNRPGIICEKCIDISMNVTLNRVWTFLEENPNAAFLKANCEVIN